MKKLFAKKEVVKKEVVEFKELNDEQLDKIIGGDSRIRMGLRYNRDTEKKSLIIRGFQHCIPILRIIEI